MVESHIPASDITASGTWFWLIGIVFLCSLAAAGVFVRLTFRQKNREQYWKKFWNIVELVWLLGAATSIIGLISPAWTVASESLVSVFVTAAESDLRIAQKAATNLSQKYCAGSHRETSFCDALRQLQQVHDVRNTTYLRETWGNYTSSVNEFEKDNNIQDINDGEIWVSMDRVIGLSQDLAYDISRTFPLPDWIFWLRAFSPHIFAFVFALRLGRAFAVFSFK